MQCTCNEHIRHIKIQGDMNNNMMERLNGEFRDREKVMRGVKKTDSPSITGYQIFHNFVREHEGLKGKTPAEAAGVKYDVKNWKDIIKLPRLAGGNKMPSRKRKVVKISQPAPRITPPRPKLKR